ncbi:flagellar hook-basal body complex protein [Rhizobiales bacterium RZME27]|uniref:Flagellar hook protein FlgE n=1 Tax=Endobacterium cereale TaxID=2663029 RepID=A0A6A8ABD5_9HYPH|nr:flagellar hook protein FlgE [Endobacterium cereale]MEB2843259.1 flagellar hook protein FlgE [Endobacterium cereale]MQY47217.1 flagellar hook-basal body complex protein [Endobacterium cereale]
MSLSGAMRTAVSGMNAQANRLGAIADNIANANTAGYKKVDTQFSSMIMPATNGTYNSGSVGTTTRYSIDSQGAFSYTKSSSDLAIDGEGFFVVSGPDGSEYLTRAGNFEVQSDGTLENAAGYTLMGYPYSSQNDPTIVINGFDGLTAINVSSGGMTAIGSSAGTLQANLPAGAAVGDVSKTSLVAFDSQGNARLLDVEYTKTGDNAWTVAMSYEGETVLDPVALTFDTDGELISPDSLTTLPLDLAGTELASLDIDISGSSQLGAAFEVMTGKIDGSAASDVSGYEISADGVLSLIYANGKVEPKFRIAMANVQSPNNLTPLPGNVYAASNDSGVVVIGYAGGGSFGEIMDSALEDSNVDLAEELTNMIQAQRIYTANSKVFQTGSELLETLVNLKR